MAKEMDLEESTPRIGGTYINTSEDVVTIVFASEGGRRIRQVVQPGATVDLELTEHQVSSLAPQLLTPEAAKAKAKADAASKKASKADGEGADVADTSKAKVGK